MLLLKYYVKKLNFSNYNNDNILKFMIRIFPYHLKYLHLIVIIK